MQNLQECLQGGKSDKDAFGNLRAAVRPGIKRIFDFSWSVILIIFLIPVFILISLAIILTGQSPFYAHVRVGRDGRKFGCLKFRTMRRNADQVLTRLLESDPTLKSEWEANRKLRHDPRVTRLGRTLRVTSLDEIPQLFNILIGQMSFVGPRPVTREEFDHYYNPFAAAVYSSVRPGLTGSWQVNGRNELGYDARVILDTEYALQLSLRTDMVILVRTLSAVVRRKGAW